MVQATGDTNCEEEGNDALDDVVQGDITTDTMLDESEDIVQ